MIKLKISIFKSNERARIASIVMSVVVICCTVDLAITCPVSVRIQYFQAGGRSSLVPYSYPSSDGPNTTHGHRN
jgi:hypothetical protein